MRRASDGRIKRYPLVQFKKDTWEIDEFDVASMYLLVGQEKAMLIDCGMGLGDLRGAVEMITDKPLIVVITHNHLDHTGNARQFEEIWMSPDDLGDPIPGDYERRRTDLISVALRQHGNICSGMYNTYPLYAYDLDRDLIIPDDPMPVIHPITDGMEFDLGGGRIVTAYKCPGHTKGQMMFLDHQTRSLFCGDALNYNLGVGAVPIEETIAYMEKMQEMGDQYDGIYNGHHDFRAQGAPLGEDCLPNALALARQIRDGNCSVIEVPTFWGPASTRPNRKMIQKYRNFLGYRGFDKPMDGKGGK